MLINQFNGGLNTRPRPQMIGINQAVVYENIDNSAGSLAPVKRALPVTLSVNDYPFWYVAGNKWLFASGSYVPRVELNRKVYEANIFGMTVYNPTSSRPAGVEKPTPAPTAVAELSPGIVASATLKATPVASALALPAGTYSYLLLNRNAIGYSKGLTVQITATGQLRITDTEYDREGPKYIKDFEQVVSPFLGTFQSVSIGPVSAVIDPAYGLDVFRIYKGVHRKVGTLTAFDDVLVDNIFDISSQPELGDTDFSPLIGVYQYLVTHVNSDGIESEPSELSAEVDLGPGGQAFLTIPQNFVTGTTTRIYRVGGNLTTFSLVAEVPGTTAVYTDTIPDVDIDGRVLTSQQNTLPPEAMSALVTAYGMLFGAKDNTLRYTDPGEPEYWPEAYSIPFPLPITGLAPVSNGMLVMTINAVYLVTGSGPLTLSVQLLRGDQGCLDSKSIQIIEGNALWASKEGLCLSSGSSIQVITKDLLGKIDFGTVRSSVVYDEVYYISYNGNKVLAADFRFGGLLFKTFSFPEAPTTLTFFRDPSTLYFYANANKYIPFASTANATFKYKSPRFIEGRATENKLYKKIYFYAENAVVLKIIINDVLVATKAVTAGTKDSITAQVPQELQRGFFIQFEIEGDGEVFEVEYQVEGRNNV